MYRSLTSSLLSPPLAGHCALLIRFLCSLRHATERVERPGESQEALDGKKDGIFIRSYAEFVLGEQVQHMLYTDSSSARQLASRQGCSRARHVSGKILWLQDKTQDTSILLRQVQTVWNIADIGTKCLSRQRLYLLMHKAGLVYIPSLERVGAEERDFVPQQMCCGFLTFNLLFLNSF